MNRLDFLRGLSFGSRVAEEELALLESYFVETAQWARIASGEVDIVYGPKGSGKSALYSLLLKREDEFRDKSIVLIPAENPRGAPAFQGLRTDPPSSEIEFVAMWKLYFISLLCSKLEDIGCDSRALRNLKGLLEEVKLRKGGRSLTALVRAVADYVRRIASFEGGIPIDSISGLPTGVSAKISLREPTPAQRDSGVISVDDLVAAADAAWRDSDLTAWILLDRLDVAFADDAELEERALRALFKAYLDFYSASAFGVKVFLRSDIWKRLTAHGFREASHVTREVTISWDAESLLDLILKRVLNNEAVRKKFNIASGAEPRTYQRRQALFHEIFPASIHVRGYPRSAPFFSWVLNSTRDATEFPQPREVIHLLTAARDSQIKMLELGEDDGKSHLMGVAAFRSALAEVSSVRLEKTIYAEYPRLRKYIEAFKGRSMQQSLPGLMGLWHVNSHTAQGIASELASIGFLAVTSKVYWVPFLYRDALSGDSPNRVEASDFSRFEQFFKKAHVEAESRN